MRSLLSCGGNATQNLETTAFTSTFQTDISTNNSSFPFTVTSCLYIIRYIVIKWVYIILILHFTSSVPRREGEYPTSDTSTGLRTTAQRA